MRSLHVTSLGAADLSVRIASAPTTATATTNATQSTAGWRSVQGAGSAYPGFGVSVPRPAAAAEAIERPAGERSPGLAVVARADAHRAMKRRLVGRDLHRRERLAAAHGHPPALA